jgi:CelD/BcsL family acetyltransferase involved in cellulose biosynthesis
MIALETHDRVVPLAREWDDLADRLDASPFLRPGWIAVWCDAFASGSLAVIGIRRGGELVGVVPLCRRRGELRSASNEHSPEFGFLAADREVAAELARAVYAGNETTVRLDFIDRDDVGLQECKEIGEQQGYRNTERLRLRSPYLAIGRDWAEYTGRLARKPLYEAERRLRRLDEAGTVMLEVADGSERLEALLEQGFEIEASGWKGDQGTAITARPETRAFYSGVARWAAERGWLRLAFLRLDGRPLAFVLGLETGDAFYAVKEGFDPAFRRFGPGAVLRFRLLARAFSCGLRRYEFLGDAEPWKLEWTDSYRERVFFRAFAPSLLGLSKWTVHTHGYRLAKRMPLTTNARALLRR